MRIVHADADEECRAYADSVPIVGKRPRFEDGACRAIACPLGDGGDTVSVDLMPIYGSGVSHKFVGVSKHLSVGFRKV